MPRLLVLGSHQQSFHCFRYLMDAGAGATGVEIAGLVAYQTQPPIGLGEDARDLGRARERGPNRKA